MKTSEIEKQFVREIIRQICESGAVIDHYDAKDQSVIIKFGGALHGISGRVLYSFSEPTGRGGGIHAKVNSWRMGMVGEFNYSKASYTVNDLAGVCARAVIQDALK